MATILASVQTLVGQAWVRDESGNLRELKVGDSIMVGERVVTAQGASVDLLFENNEVIQVAGNQILLMTDNLASNAEASEDESLVSSDIDLDAVLAALEGEGDLFEDLEAPAAGEAGGGSGSSSIVQLMRVAEQTDGIEYGRISQLSQGEQNILDAFPGQASVDSSTPATITVDTTAPDAPTDLVVSGDGTIVSGTGEPGATVVITDPNGDEVGSGVVGADGNFEVELTAPQTNGEELTATQTDGAGNTSLEATVTAPDTTAPNAPTDLVVSDDGTTVTGTGEPGATVEVTDPNGGVIGSGVVDEDGNFEVELTAPQTNGEEISAVQTDAAGNESPEATVTAPDTTAPSAPTSIKVGNGDEFITVNEIDAEGKVDVVVGLPTDVVAGDTVVVNGVEQDLTEDDITAGEAIVKVIGPAEGEELIVTATIKDPAGNISPELTKTLGIVDTSAPDSTTTFINVSDLTDDNTINAAEAGGNVAVSGSVTGEFQANDAVTVVVNDTNYTGTVAADGSFSIDVAGSDLVADADNVLEASVVATDAAGNTGTVNTTKSYGVDTDIEGGIVTIAPVTGDNVINRVEAAEEYTAISGTATGGDIAEGDVVTVTVNGEKTTTVVGTDREWAVSVKTSDLTTNGDVIAEVVSSDQAGNTVTSTGGVTVTNSTVVNVSIKVTASAKVIDTDSDFTNLEGVTATASNNSSKSNATSKISVIEGTNHDGIGVKTTRPGWWGNDINDSDGDTRELGFNETLTFEFDKDINSMDVAFAWRNNSETAKVTFYQDGDKKGHATISGVPGSSEQAFVRYYNDEGDFIKEVKAQGSSDEVDDLFTFELPGEGDSILAFDKVEFTAPTKTDDYLINQIRYKEEIGSGSGSGSGSGNVVVDENGNVTFAIQTNENYVPDGDAYATVFINRGDATEQELSVKLNATGNASFTVESKDLGDLSNVTVEVTEITGHVINPAEAEFDFLSSSVLFEASLEADNFSGTDGLVDSFAWSLATASDQQDTVTNFNASETDVLDLSAIFEGDVNAEMDLTSYLSFTKEGEDTLLNIYNGGDGDLTQAVLLKDVDLVQSGTEQDDIIKNLIDSGNLNID